MPHLAEQHERMKTFPGPFTVLRLLTPLKMDPPEREETDSAVTNRRRAARDESPDSGVGITGHCSEDTRVSLSQ
jgi:hypothetical protein